MPEKTQALKGRNRRCVNQCAHVPPFQGFGELGHRRTQGDRVQPRVALRSTLGYLIMPRWGERSGYGSVLIAHRRRPKLRWVIRDGVCPMVLCPNGAAGDSPGQSEARPGIRVRETTQALKGRNRRCVNQCAHVSPFQGFGELGRRPT